jgi:hypothetical protein
MLKIAGIPSIKKELLSVLIKAYVSFFKTIVENNI